MVTFREWTIIGSEPILGVSYRRIISATVVSADITCITAGSSTVDGCAVLWSMI